MKEKAPTLRTLETFAGVFFIGAWFLYFAGKGLFAPFSGDDLMNLHGYLSKPAHTLLVDNLRYWSTAYRPMGGLFYTSFYYGFGFDPLPLRMGCFTLLGVNLVLLFRFGRLLSQSSEVALLATLLFSYHAWFVDLYYSSGTIYDLLCFTFYFAAFIFYIRIRQAGRLLSLRESLIFGGFYICSLNAKEMAVTLPLFLVIYETLYHQPKITPRAMLAWSLQEGRTACMAALLTVPYVIGKVTGSGSLVENPAYRVSISPVRFLKTFHLYLNPLFY